MAPKYRKLVPFMMSCLLVFSSTTALASDLKITSQFGYGNVWAYRVPTPCNQNKIASDTTRPQSSNSTCKNPSTSAGSNPSTAAPGSTNPPATDGHYTIGSSSAQELEEWNYVNRDRTAAGLAALPMDPELCRLARMKSQDMLTNHYFAHTSPTLGNSATMLRTYGYSFVSVGENIARYGTVAKAHVALMNSPGHRQNIMSSGWTKVGIGIVQDQNGFVYITQLFVR